MLSTVVCIQHICCEGSTNSSICHFGTVDFFTETHYYQTHSFNDMTHTTQLHTTIDAMPHARVLVVGDSMLDAYEHCVVKRISPEAPVPIAVVVDDSFFLGGAANVAHNARALGAQVSIVSVVGDDEEGRRIRTLLDAEGIHHAGLITDSQRVTTQKKRVVSGTQQLMRIDREVTYDIRKEIQAEIHVTLEKLIHTHDVIIISDYCKGLLSPSTIQFIKKEAEKRKVKIFVDSKDTSLRKYTDVYLIKPNKEEAEHLAGEKFTPAYTNLESIGGKLSKSFGSNVVITLGADGMALFADNHFSHQTTKAQQVYDVSGAGDTVLATIATAVSSGISLEDAVTISNYTAGYVVSQLGTVVCSQKTLKKILSS